MPGQVRVTQGSAVVCGVAVSLGSGNLGEAGGRVKGKMEPRRQQKTVAEGSSSSNGQVL